MKNNQPETAKGRSNSKTRSGQKPDALREQAESRLSERNAAMPQQDARRTLHELEVHQIELEMQNESLRQAQDIITASQERYADMYDFAPVGYFTFDGDGLVTEVNLPGALLVGVERGQLKGKPFSLFVAAPYKDTFHLHYRGILKTGTADMCELQLTRKDGTSFYVLVQSVPVRDAAGNLSGVRSAIVDITERKQAEDVLQRYELLARHSRDIILFVQRGDGRILEANAAATRAYGYSHEELLAHSIQDLRAPETQKATADQMAAADHQGILFETSHRRKDGSTFPVEVSSQGATVGGTRALVSVVRDITERKRTEQVLQESEEQYRNLFNTMDEGFCVVEMIFDSEGKPSDYRFLRVNAAFENQTGLHDAEGKLMRDLAPDHEAHWFEIYGKIALTGHPLRFVNEAKALHRWFEVYAYRVSKPENRQVAIVFHDITEQKQMEEELRTSRDELELRVREKTADALRLAVAVDKSAEATVITDPSWMVQYANPAFYQLTSYRSDEVIGREMTFLRSEEEDQSIYEMTRRAAIDGAPKTSRHVIKGKDGTIPVESLISSVRNDSGAITNFVFRWRDVSEQLNLEEQLRQAHKMQAIGTLAGGIAHDFNNILAAMIGFTEMVLDDVADDRDAQHKLEQVLKAGFRARDLVKQILAFSRKTAAERKEISLTPLVKETHALLRSSLPSTIQMPLVITTGDDCVVANPTQVQQVLMNLATNAAHAMREHGGLLTIGISSVTFPHGSLPDPDMEPGSYVKLTVQDTGPGMTKEVRQRIFEPFFTTKGPGEGTGMGLAVVYGVVKDHQGTVTIQSEPGQGSTFEVFLPQVQKPDTKKEEAAASVLPTGTERILFVDDEELVVEMARGMLESLGYHATVAANGTDAWNLFSENPSRFDLVITDQTMPDLTGINLAQKMLEVRKDIPIILCTGYSETVSAEKAQEVGIRAFVMKPVVRKELAQTVRRVLDERTAGV